MSSPTLPVVNLDEVVKTSQVITVEGITLPWAKTEYRTGEVTETGEVFISYDALEVVAEAGVWDSDFGGSIPNIGYLEEKALVQAGLAGKRSRGAIYGTDELKALIRRLW